MNDAEILGAISAQYGDRLESLTPAQKVCLLTRLASHLHGYEAPPVALCRQVDQLSHHGTANLMEAMFAQLKAGTEV